MLTASAAAGLVGPRRGELAQGALELLGEDQAGGVEGDGPQRVERGGDLLGRAATGERATGLGLEQLDEVVGGAGEPTAQQLGGLLRRRRGSRPRPAVGARGRAARRSARRTSRRPGARAARRRRARPRAGADACRAASCTSASVIVAALVVGPARAQRLVDAEPLGHRRGRLARATEQRLDRLELEAAAPGARRSSSSRSRCSGVVARLASVAPRRGQHTLRLVVADRAAADAARSASSSRPSSRRRLVGSSSTADSLPQT